MLDISSRQSLTRVEAECLLVKWAAPGGNPASPLRQVSRPVDWSKPFHRQLAEAGALPLVLETCNTWQDFCHLMFSLKDLLGPAVGLAAPQIGVNLRVIVIGMKAREAQPLREMPARPEVLPMIMVNPVVVKKTRLASTGRETCLSVDNTTLYVERAEGIRVNFQDLEGRKRERTFFGWPARVIQHELDHLDGVLLVDYLRPERSDAEREAGMVALVKTGQMPSGYGIKAKLKGFDPEI